MPSPEGVKPTTVSIQTGTGVAAPSEAASVKTATDAQREQRQQYLRESIHYGSSEQAKKMSSLQKGIGENVDVVDTDQHGVWPPLRKGIDIKI